MLPELARGGQIAELRKIGSPGGLRVYLDEITLMVEAAKYGQEATLDYLLSRFQAELRPFHFDSEEDVSFASALIENNRPDFSWSILQRILPTTTYRVQQMVKSAGRAGSILLLDNLLAGFDQTTDLANYDRGEQFQRALDSALFEAFWHNHLDAFGYLYDRGARFQEKERFRGRIHPTTLEVLVANKLITSLEAKFAINFNGLLTNQEKVEFRQLVDATGEQ